MLNRVAYILLTWFLLGFFWTQPNSIGHAEITAKKTLSVLTDGEPVKIKTKKIENFHIGNKQTTFGSLTFLGGLELISADRAIGGLSAIVSLGEGKEFLAITDNAVWVAFSLEEDENGKLKGIKNTRYARLRDNKGRPLSGRRGHDTEAITIKGKKILVSAERVNKIYQYPWPLKSGKERMIRSVSLPDGWKNLRRAKGIEAIAVAPQKSDYPGALFAIAERGPAVNATANLPGFILHDHKTIPFSIKRTKNYDATDMAFLPDGDFLLLERRFNLKNLIGMRLRRFNTAKIKYDHALEGKTLLEAGFTYQIDNMEGLSVHQDKNGETILTLVSDDNRSLLQRNLILRFRLEN